MGDRLGVGDFTGDGKAEPARAKDLGDNTMRIFRWTSTATAFTGPPTFTSGPFGLRNVADRMAAGDVNGDGKDALVMACQDVDTRSPITYGATGSAMPAGGTGVARSTSTTDSRW